MSTFDRPVCAGCNMIVGSGEQNVYRTTHPDGKVIQRSCLRRLPADVQIVACFGCNQPIGMLEAMEDLPGSGKVHARSRQTCLRARARRRDNSSALRPVAIAASA